VKTEAGIRRIHNITGKRRERSSLICEPNLKCLASSAPQIWPGPQNVEIGHVTLTTPTWRIVSHHKGNTFCGQLVVYTKFEVSNFSRSRNISGGVKF